MDRRRIECALGHCRNLVGAAAAHWRWLAIAVILTTLPGCSLFVMAGKMLNGDPMTDSMFESYTKRSIADDEKRVVVVCNSPESIKSEFGSLDMDLLSQVALRMRQHKINIVDPHKVANYIDDRGGYVDLLDLGIDQDADFIVRIDLETFSFKEENSPELYRGRSSGKITVYEVVHEDEDGERKDRKSAKKEKPSDDKKGSKKLADKKKTADKSDDEVRLREIFNKGFASTFPQHSPQPAESMPVNVFRKRYLDRVSDEVASTFYKELAGADIK